MNADAENDALAVRYNFGKGTEMAGTVAPADSAATLRSLLRSSPGESLCDACLALACSVSLIAMRSFTDALVDAESDEFHRAATCVSCGRTVPSIVYR